MSRATQLFSTSTVPAPDMINKEGYAAYGRTLEEDYLQMLLTNSMHNTFYSSQSELVKEAEQLHKQMIAKDPQFVGKALVFARQEGYMRLQPIYGLALLSVGHPDIMKEIFEDVILIPSDLEDFLAIIQSMGRGQGGRAIKKAVAKFLNNKLSEYWAIKYKGTKNEKNPGSGYMLRDIIITAHPKTHDKKKNAIYSYLIGKDYDKSLLPQVQAFENLTKAKTDEERIACITEGRLPHEVVTGAVGSMTPALWDSVLQSMPIFAMLRSLNIMERNGILKTTAGKALVTDKLNNREALLKSKILPFRFLTAFKAVNDNWLRDVLRNAVEITAQNLPEIQGKTAIHLDRSGSMGGENILTGSVFAYALYKKSDALLYSFDHTILPISASKHDSILSQAERVTTSGATDTGICMRKMLQDRTVIDNIIIITDEQQNAGRNFFAELKAYRRNVNKDVKAFIIDISSSRAHMVPPTDLNTFYIYGFSDQVLSYIAYTTKGMGSMVEAVKNR